MHSNFWHDSIPCQSVITNNMPDWNKYRAIEGPLLCIQMYVARIKPIQIRPMLHHGDNLKIWCDIVHSFLSWGYTDKSSQSNLPPSSNFIHTHGHHPKEWWIHLFLAPYVHKNHLNIYTIFASHKCGRVTRTHHTLSVREDSAEWGQGILFQFLVEQSGAPWGRVPAVGPSANNSSWPISHAEVGGGWQQGKDPGLSLSKMTTQEIISGTSSRVFLWDDLCHFRYIEFEGNSPWI